jgi:hypothetical protein
MKQVLNYALFGIVVAVAASLFSTYGLPSFTGMESTSFATAQMMGHVEYTLKDADGNIKAYRQLDNVIVDQGEDCAASYLFTNVTGGTVAANNVVPDPAGGANTCFTSTSPYVHIAIGNGSNSGGSIATSADTALQQEHNNTGTGLVRTTDSRPVFTSASGGTPSKVVLSKDFTLDTSGGVSSPMVVNESGLFNSTTIFTPDHPLTSGGVGMFARQTFADVSIGNGESLTVEWTINIGGAATLGGAEET